MVLAVFLTSGFAEMVPASGSVPAGCGGGLFPSWMGGICSQTKCLTDRLHPVICYHNYSTKIVRFKVFSCLWSFMWSKRFPPQATGTANHITALEYSAPLHFTDLQGKVKAFLAECEIAYFRTLPLQAYHEPRNHLPSMALLRYSADSVRASASFW